RTRKNVGSCDRFKTGMAGLPLAFRLIFGWQGDERNCSSSLVPTLTEMGTSTKITSVQDLFHLEASWQAEKRSCMSLPIKSPLHPSSANCPRGTACFPSGFRPSNLRTPTGNDLLMLSLGHARIPFAG